MAWRPFLRYSSLPFLAHLMGLGTTLKYTARAQRWEKWRAALLHMPRRPSKAESMGWLLLRVRVARFRPGNYSQELSVAPPELLSAARQPAG